MARLSGRPAEPGLRHVPLPLLVLALAGPGVTLPAAAQEEPAEGPPRAGALLEIGAGLTSLAGEVTTVLDGSALIELSPGVAVGGGGTVFPAERVLEGDILFPEREMGFGYGGVVLEVDVRSMGKGTRLALRGLLGAGNADLRDPATGARLASDNVVVVEPAVTLRRGVGSRLHLGLSLSYRGVAGLDDIEDVEAGDLGGLEVGIHLRIGPL